MKKKSGYWWIFVVSAIVWVSGTIGIVVGVFACPESNLLGGLGLVFLPIAWLGAGVFQLTLVVWVIHQILKLRAQKRYQKNNGDL